MAKIEATAVFNLLDGRTLDARPDTLDFRDLMYVPTLVEVPTEIPLTEYQKHKIPILNQGREGACTGFGLATVANYLLTCRKVYPDPTQVSPRMLYELAKRHDEWPGENYSGSSAPGAMKAWHKHGVCSEECWPYKAKDKVSASGLTKEHRVGAARTHRVGQVVSVCGEDGQEGVPRCSLLQACRQTAIDPMIIAPPPTQVLSSTERRVRNLIGRFDGSSRLSAATRSAQTASASGGQSIKRGRGRAGGGSASTRQSTALSARGQPVTAES